MESIGIAVRCCVFRVGSSQYLDAATVVLN
ncbi:unnamed protein product [Ectocarpus sp. CCAP 1310/34]|nr:unnamed protein product [Ectocarpus sp. CCAP 1310/34]